jgi:CubicO group peptidase (beta-lactamase class C family)
MRLKSLSVAALCAIAAPAPAAVIDRLAPLFAPGQGETRAALLIVDGRVAAKRYAPGYSDRNRFISWSMAKTATALLVGELVADGRLTLDAPAPVAEWRRPGDPRARITLRQLLHMTSGLRHVEVGEPVWASDTNQAEFVTGTRAMAAYGIAKPLAHAPGTRWEYSTLTTIILSEIVTRTLTPSRDPRVRARAYRDFASERLWRPAGISTAVMEFDGAGTQVGGSLIHMSLDDWGRFGTVLLDGRGARGAEIVSASWLAFLRTPAPVRAEYGGQLWLNRTGRRERPWLFPGAPADTVAARGHLTQIVAASPSRRAVVVRLGHTPDPEEPRVAAAVGRVLAALPISR